MSEAAEVTDLLQHLIRNRCVNEGTPESGHEIRSVDLLASYLSGPGVEMRKYEPLPGRGNLVVKIEGSDPKAPRLMLMGHIDVVPANEAGWSRDPFAAELVDGFVWGRGAVDMLNTTAAIAVAVRRAIKAGLRPKGTLIFMANADEEAAGVHGAEWMVREHWDDIRCDWCVTELGGYRAPFGTSEGPRLVMNVGEKGSNWVHLTVKGTPGHGSMPLRTDNAVVKAARIVDRLASYRPPPTFDEAWRRSTETLGMPPDVAAAFSDPAAFDAFVEAQPVGVARQLYSRTHTTFAPNIIRGGRKINVIAEDAEIDVDIRTLPGVSQADVHDMLREAIGEELWRDVTIAAERDNPSTTSPTDTPLYESLARISAKLRPGAVPVPDLVVGATDARFLRRKGVVAYGYALLSDLISFDTYWQMFHGNDERIDQESLRLSVALFDELIAETVA